MDGESDAGGKTSVGIFRRTTRLRSIVDGDHTDRAILRGNSVILLQNVGAISSIGSGEWFV